MMNVATILELKGSSVVTVKPDTRITDVVRVLAGARIGAVVISSDGKRVKGILSERDIVAALAGQGADVLTLQASELMTSKVTTCVLDDDIAGLMSVMTDKRIRHVPVIRQGELCGIVSIGDVVKWRVGEIEQEADALRAYVAQA
jgi:CBS domain-containing protein